MHRTTSPSPPPWSEASFYEAIGHIWNQTGESFLAALVRRLATLLEARAAMIALPMVSEPMVTESMVAQLQPNKFQRNKPQPNSAQRMRSVTAWIDGAAQGFEYELAGAPCEQVMAGQLCHYPSGLARQFPRDPLPAAMGMDCYLGSPLIGRGGQPLGVLAVLDDRPLRDPEHARALVQFCSVRAAAELEYLRMVDELRISELRYHALFEAANDAIFVARRVRVAQCNSKALELFRCKEKELVGKTVAELSPAFQPDGWRSLHKARALTCRVLAGEPLLVEWKCRRPDGSLFDGELSMKALTAGGERLLQCLVRDIGERKRVLQALQQSEERFEKAFHLSPEPMSILDIEGRHVDINNVALEKIEYRREQVIGRTAEEIGIAIDPTVDILDEFRSGAAIRNRERQFRTASGKVITVLLSAELIQIGGQPHILVMAPDITERKCTECALAQSEQRFKTAFRSSPIPMAIARWHGGIVDVNDEAMRIFGLTLGEALGKTADELGLSVEPAARLREEVHNAGMSVRNRETQYRTRSGELRTILLSVEQIQLNGEPHMLWMGPDVTEQKRHEEWLRMLSSAVTAATDAILITDNDLRPTPTVLYANAAFTRLTGYTGEEIVGRRTSETFGAGMDAKTALRIQQVLSSGNDFHGEVTNMSKDGRTLHLELDIVPVRNSNGEITNFVAVRRDISRRRAHELNRQRLLHLVFEAQAEERRRISRELHDHAGQLLSSMLLRLEALQQKTTEASVKRAIGEISSVASSTLEDLSRLARGLHPAVLDDLGLVEALRRSLDEFQGAGISAKLIASGNTERLPQNVEHEIYQIVKEALTNVRKHSQARHVVLSLGRLGSVLAASIADDGVGFDSATASTERAGLGIVGMNERAALLGGTLSVHSRAGAGTVVNVSIPVSVPESTTLNATLNATSSTTAEPKP